MKIEDLNETKSYKRFEPSINGRKHQLKKIRFKYNIANLKILWNISMVITIFLLAYHSMIMFIH